MKKSKAVGRPEQTKATISKREYKEHFVQRNHHRIYIREYAGDDPAIILMHGFPDNLHLYDRLVSYLSAPRRIVATNLI